MVFLVPQFLLEEQVVVARDGIVLVFPEMNPGILWVDFVISQALKNLLVNLRRESVLLILRRIEPGSGPAPSEENSLREKLSGRWSLWGSGCSL